jgi:HPt (histidine-containing phosphotransfer) domain-containing protein
MEITWDHSKIDMNNLIEISRGDAERMEKHLRQFQQLIPERIDNLRKSLDQEERKMVRQTLHKMSPQLQFFGVPGVLIPIRRLEHEYETMPFDELDALVGGVLL